MTRVCARMYGDRMETIKRDMDIMRVKREAKSMLERDSVDVMNNVLTADQMMDRIVEVRDMEGFKQKVVERKKPVVLFCMARWCNTSKQILPMVLDQYASHHNQWDMSIFDIDSDGKITTLLKIDKVPTVLLIHNGEVIDGRLR